MKMLIVKEESQERLWQFLWRCCLQLSFALRQTEPMKIHVLPVIITLLLPACLSRIGIST